MRISSLVRCPRAPSAKKVYLAVELHARLVVGLVAAVAGDAHVAGRDALHRAVVVEQDFGGRKAREYLDAQLLGLSGQPAAQIAEAAV